MKKILKFLPAVVAAVAIVVATSLSWLAIENPIDFPTSFSGSTRVSYFASGDGSKDDPYIIATPTHMYNLAWLQYLGYFNLGGYINNGRAQSFFKVAADIDMQGLVIPPIGTREYPFIGNFNGNNKVIYNFVVSNTKSGKSTNGKYNLTKYPRRAEFDNTSGVLLTTGTVADTATSAQVNIVGMFGITGDIMVGTNEAANSDSFVNTYYKTKADRTLNIQEYQTDGKTLVELPADTSADDFYYSGMKISGFYIDKVIVNTESEKSLVGILAGYIGSTVKNTGVYRSKISVKPDTTGGLSDLLNSKKEQQAYGTVVSKYSLVGDYDSNVVGWTENPSGDSDTGSGTWGGSIDMKSMFNRLSSFKDAATGVNPNTYEDSVSNQKRFYDEDKGSVYFAASAYSSILYLYGGKNENVYSSKNVPDGGFFIRSDGNYLTLNGAGEYDARNTTDPNMAVTWYFNNDDGSLYTYVGGIKYYLNGTGASLRVSSAQTSSWKRDYANEYLSYDYSQVLNSKIYTTTYYLVYANGWKLRNYSPLSVTFDNTGKNLISNIKYTYSGTINGKDRSFATYIPILTNADYTVSDDNPGYITSGSTNVSYSGSSGTPVPSGDIRVQKGTSLSTELVSSLNGATSFGDGTTLELLTKTKNSGNAFVRIKDSFNENNTSVNAALSGYNKLSVQDLGLNVYDRARTSLNDLLLNQSDYYGLHFMNAPINEDNVLVAPKVKINGVTNYDYKMPANALTFSAPSKGHVSFFAGTYYDSNKNFFSLHRIIRNADKSISQIKEISQIYSKSGSKYIYLYSDGTYSDTLSAGYELEFDCDWIVNPEIVSNAMYYFEIPVNKGDEYALGSATTGAGAYLMYLDIGANGDDGGEEPGAEDLPYIMKSVDFVSMSDADTTFSVPTGGYPKYQDVGFELSGSKIDDEVFFKRANYAADVTGDIDTIVYFWREKTLIGYALVPTDTSIGKESQTEATW